MKVRIMFVAAIAVAAGLMAAGEAAALNNNCRANGPSVSGATTGSWLRGTRTITWSTPQCDGDETVTITATRGAGTHTLATSAPINSSFSWNTAGVLDGTGYTITTKVNNSGRTSTSTTYNVDNTAPTIGAAARTPAPNAAGWNTTDVTVSWSCSDNLAASAASTSATVTGEGANLSATGTCADLAGNTASATVTGIKIDKTAPSIAFDGQTPAANGAGWNNSDVTLEWTCDDALSGVANAGYSSTIGVEGTGLGATGTCVDLAGNEASDTRGGVNIDKTDPTIELASRAPEANDAGWNDSAVTVEWSCGDEGSGALLETVSATIATEGTDQSASGTCEDAAGNTASSTENGISVDTSAPSIAFDGQSPAANDAGWNNSPVTLSWSCTDDVSAAVEATLSETLASEGADQSAGATCTDLAGNTASDQQGGVDIDRTDPSIELASREPAANEHGWNDGPVTVTWSCSDELSGAAEAQVSDTVSGDGADQTASAACTDAAGNTAGDSLGDINVDQSAPSITLASRTPANAAGWNTGDVTVAWSCSDDVSSVLDETLSEILTDEGAEQTASATCEDLAGNSSSDSVGDINIDKTAATGSVLTTGLVVRALDGTIDVSAIDTLSGVASATVTFTDALGNTTSVEASCVTSCGLGFETWRAQPPASLLPGPYSVRVTVGDVAGNPGTPSPAAQIVLV